MSSVTLDSNVFRKIASPESFPKDPDFPVYRQIADAIIAKRLDAFVCDSMLNIEAIEKAARVQFYSSYEPKSESTVVASSGLKTHMRFAIKPDPDAHPGISHSLRRHIQDGFRLGIKIRRAPRVGFPAAPAIPSEYFEVMNPSSFHQKHERLSEAADFIESKGWGISHIKALALTTKRPGPWFKILQFLDDENRGKAPKAIAEWADGESVASHIGAGSDYYCTLDFGKKAGESSVFFPLNRKQLSDRYRTVFVTPKELLREISKN